MKCPCSLLPEEERGMHLLNVYYRDRFDKQRQKTMDFRKDSRFKEIVPFEHKVWLSSPTMHGDEQRFVDEAIRTNWVSTIGANINTIERELAQYIDCQHAVALSSGTAAFHLATKLAAERLYGRAKPNEGTLAGKRVFCSDMTFDASVNPVAYEGDEAVFVDTERDTWNMDPVALEKAFEQYPDVKLIVLAHLYGTPGKMAEIKRIADAHGALIVEDAAESLGAKYKLDGKWVETGAFGDYSCISFIVKQLITCMLNDETGDFGAEVGHYWQDNPLFNDQLAA